MLERIRTFVVRWWTKAIGGLIAVVVGASVWAGPTHLEPEWVPPAMPAPLYEGEGEGLDAEPHGGIEVSDSSVAVAPSDLPGFRLQVTPMEALADSVLELRIDGLSPDEEVLLTASTVDANGVRFSSWARFRADREGRLDINATEPLEGTYRSADGAGLLWSMRAGDAPFVTSMQWAERVYEISAETMRGRATTEIVRRYPWASLRHETVESASVRGELWLPETVGPAPAIIRLGGYGDGPAPLVSSLLAARGFVVLDLRYHGDGSGMPALVEVPLERVTEAIDYLEGRSDVTAGTFGVMGTSKGAELALLAAAHDARVRGVAAWVPSSVAFAGISFSDPTPPSSWTWKGNPLEVAPARLTVGGVRTSLRLAFRRPVAVREAYEDLLARSPDAARIPIEQIQGPVVLVGGTDDQVWPSGSMVGELVDRAASRAFVHDVSAIVVPGGGHALTMALWPSGSVGDSFLFRGGSPEANHLGGQRAWQATLAMFAEALGVGDFE